MALWYFVGNCSCIMTEPLINHYVVTFVGQALLMFLLSLQSHQQIQCLFALLSHDRTSHDIISLQQAQGYYRKQGAASANVTLPLLVTASVVISTSILLIAIIIIRRWCLPIISSRKGGDKAIKFKHFNLSERNLHNLTTSFKWKKTLGLFTVVSQMVVQETCDQTLVSSLGKVATRQSRTCTGDAVLNPTTFLVGNLDY